MSDQPLVSVVIASRDRQHLVAGAVRSVLAQTYPHLEVFLVDDGSEPPIDLPGSVAADRRVHRIRLERSIGVGPARDLAIARARGEFVAFCDDDDEWLPRKTEEQLAVLHGDPGAVAVESGYEMRDGTRVVARYLPGRRDAFRALLLRPVMAPSVVMVRTASVVEAGGFGPLSRTQDWDLWLRMTRGKRVIPLPVYHAIRLDHPPVSPRTHYVEHLGIFETRVLCALAGLTTAERAAIISFHLGMLGSYAAGSGDSRLARTLFLRAWWRRPRNVIHLVRICRTVVGEDAWRTAVNGASGARRSLMWMIGRDPYLQRF